ncbi:inositol monophosphatase [Glutamicibacter sp. MNS18]|uniref:inositol monophosphatase family protein n=1 Tax=Glutamicibacter sp. MNS18 TaxID=2989817 RepID=UPI00223575CB|nr:inositol monophosphatase family protein [Glutamicibacter sp. MNS18]MCW4466547.1 inositol monophosphatase [Glutamicibacter sp. MNS18]
MNVHEPLAEAQAEVPQSPAQLRAVAEQAALLAGDYLRTVFRSRMEIDYKRDRHDLVTVHDRAAEDLIVPFLLNHDPRWCIVGEESGIRGGDSAVTWYVDPIDGTSNFAQGLAFFCVSLGVEINGQLAAGVVYDPMADRLFSADDAGAWLDGQPLRTGATQPDGAATMITGYPTANDLACDGQQALADLGLLIDSFSSLRRTGSGALTLAHVAAGWTDCALGGSVNPWDVAAGALIVRRAGGSYRPLWLGEDAADRPDHHAPGFVAEGPGAHYPALDQFARNLERRRRGA